MGTFYINLTISYKAVSLEEDIFNENILALVES